MRIPCVADIMGLFLQPPLEVLPTPQSFVADIAFGDADELIRPSQYDHHMVSIRILILHQITGSELLPAWPVYPPPRKITEGSIGAQRGPARTMDASAVWTVAGRAVWRGIDAPVRVNLSQFRQGSLYAFLRDSGGGRGRGLRGLDHSC